MGPRTLWGLLAAVALLWPDRISSAFDGVPLDRPPEAILIGLVFPCLWLFHPAFLRSRGARILIVALVAWRIVAAAALVQDGWCMRFEPARRYARDAQGAPHAWDLRADWRSPDPACSAIMTRSYQSYREFPAWFFNLPPPNDSWPLPVDLPPAAITRFRVSGFVTTTAPGILGVDVGPGMTTSVIVDGAATPSSVALDAGSHQVVVAGTMTGKEWRLVPSWNGRDLWNGVAATVQRPSPGALQIRRQARWIPIGLTTLLFALWLGSALRALQNFIVPAWTIAASLGVAMLTASAGVDRARWVMPGLLAAILVPVPRRLRNMNGAFLLVGVPWLTFVAASGLSWIGLWGLYQHGNDHWMYQRYGYRIVMQGYWLEGGSPAFWFQPLYRWISGLLHAAFGDSSVGDLYWDAFGLLIGALFAFEIANRFAGFRVAISAGALTLATLTLGPNWYVIGRGLSVLSGKVYE